MIPWDFVRDSKTGAMGDPTKASAEKGRKTADAAVDKVVDLSKQLLGLTENDLRTGMTKCVPTPSGGPP
jgi:hypothetical protein